MDLLTVVGQCDNGYACVYQNNLSWSSPTTPLPAEAHPRVVFERLFGDGGSKADRARQLRQDASLLDWMTDGISRLQKKVGPGDRTKIEEYLDTVREVERRIQKAEAQTADSHLPDLDRPVGVPAAYADHAKLMFDLQVLALQGDVTRVITFQLARETSTRTYPEIGIPEAAPSADAQWRRSGKAGEGRQDQRVPRVAVRLFPREAEVDERRQRHAARSLRCTSTAAAWAIPTCTITSTCRSWSPAAERASSRADVTSSMRSPRRWPIVHLTLLDKVGVRLDSFADSKGKIKELIEPLSL